MRIEIDKELGKQLDAIKQEEPTIYGRGHAETVRFLVNYYQTHKPVQLLFEGVLAKIQCVLDEVETRVESAITRGFLKALRQAVINLFETKDENHPIKRSAAAPKGDVEGH